MKEHSAKYLKQRKFLLMLPLLTFPFITMAFWAMGGGSARTPKLIAKEGLNTELPGAKLPSEQLDKMSLYNQAAKDSMERSKLLTSDAYMLKDSLGQIYGDTEEDMAYPGNLGLSSSGAIGSHADPNEAKVRDRLQRLEQVLSEPAPSPDQMEDQGPGYQESSEMSADIDRLDKMMKAATSGTGADPEMQQIDGMLEKVLDIQFPERARQKIKEQSEKNKGRVYPVTQQKKRKEATLLSAKPERPILIADSIVPVYEFRDDNRFYGIGASIGANEESTAIPAVVHETQTLMAGATIKLRLLEEVMINGVLIPAGNFVYGNCGITGERLTVSIPGIRYGKSLYPISLSVYDLDALEGIRIPGSISRDVTKEGADRGLQGVQFMSMDPSLAAQAAGAGVEVAKGIFSKKTKLIRVTVKAGYPVLLMDAKTSQELQQ